MVRSSAPEDMRLSGPWGDTPVGKPYSRDVFKLFFFHSSFMGKHTRQASVKDAPLYILTNSHSIPRLERVNNRSLGLKIIQITANCTRYEFRKRSTYLGRGKLHIHMSSCPICCALVTTDGMEEGNVATWRPL